ncbi:MAG: methyltransferase domain-containing protein, partial [archaeon]
MDEIKLLKIKEGETWLKVPDLNVYKKPEYAPVFYNPEMAFDRSVSVEFLRIVKPNKVLDLLCGIGARGIRYAKEVGVNVICNDACEKAVEIAKENAGINGVEVEFSNEEANRFLLKSMGKFECIDIDPFGSPVYFLNNSFLRIIPKGGYLMCTATDTGTLCGKFAKRTFKRYFVKSEKNSAEHEIGVRTLIGCIVRFGLMYDISVKVQYAYARKHYYRVCVKTMGSKNLDENMEKIGFYKGIGPI